MYFTHQDKIKEGHLHLKAENPVVSKVRRVQSATWAGYYIPVQKESRAPLGDVEPLEEDAFSLTIEQVDPKKEAALV